MSKYEYISHDLGRINVLSGNIFIERDFIYSYLSDDKIFLVVYVVKIGWHWANLSLSRGYT
jgi:hypothetical protein